MRAKALPSRDLLLSRYKYDPDTGILTTHKGRPVGSYSKKEKRLITSIDNRKYYVARLIWMIHHGEDPGELIIDHINRDACDNRIENLRAIPQSENVKNNPRCDSPKLAVYHNGAYQAQLTVKGKAIYVGRFSTLEEANEAAVQKRNFLLAA